MVRPITKQDLVSMTILFTRGGIATFYWRCDSKVLFISTLAADRERSISNLPLQVSGENWCLDNTCPELALSIIPLVIGLDQPASLTDTRSALIDNIFCMLSSNTVKCASGIFTDRLTDHKLFFASINLHPRHKK